MKGIMKEMIIQPEVRKNQTGITDSSRNAWSGILLKRRGNVYKEILKK